MVAFCARVAVSSNSSWSDSCMVSLGKAASGVECFWLETPHYSVLDKAEIGKTLESICRKLGVISMTTWHVNGLEK